MIRSHRVRPVDGSMHRPSGPPRGGARIPLLVVTLALLVSACSSAGAALAPVTDLTVAGVEFAFQEDAWSVYANEDISVTFENRGLIDHEWAVLSSPISTEEDFDESLVLFEIEKLDPSRVETDTFNLPAGTYQVVCALLGHLDAGMVGTLDVVDR